MLIGIANLNSTDGSGGSILLSGLAIFAFGLAGKAGIGIAAVVALPFLGYSYGGMVGAFAGAAPFIGAITYAVKQHKRRIVKDGFVIEQGSVVSEIHPPSSTLLERLESIYPFRPLRRKDGESPTDFRHRQLVSGRFQGHNDFEIEVIESLIVTEAGQSLPARLHRVVLYRKPGRYRKTLAKRIIEVKVERIKGGPTTVAAEGMVRCLDVGDFPASLKHAKSYPLVEGSIRVGAVTFLRIMDESDGAYFYPQFLFSPATMVLAPRRHMAVT